MMQAYTEEQRKALIGLCRIEIKRWKVASESNPNMRYMIDLMEIALAALMTEPEYNISDEYGETHIGVSKAIYDKCHEDYRWISYPAPPVAALRPIRLPDCDFGAVSHMSGGSKDYCNGFVDGTQNAIKAIRAAGYEVANATAEEKK